ncbi:hypothetical protein SAMN04489860_1300 [Paraoerskovia marina]|uniref:ThuA-like domain-containing protein n=1 Tax=Paraoerskovia marina TaxID=545619 RepID=A0A1H1RAQ9_9CELL|nr:ThuA domain-containing protein [Paraoerskovia marina]SDS32616.1 hypothetical protein SAMN04489860_1300 [Paraoerskovia marina]
MTTRRALVVRGGWEGHAPVESTDLFIPFLRAHGFDVQVEDSLEVYADEPYMSTVDLIVQCWSIGEILADEMHGLRVAVENGAGLAGWHGGLIDAFRNATDYQHLIGAQFVAHPDDFIEHTVEISPDRSDHPIVEGVSQISITSEQYWVLSDGASDVLATTTHVPREDSPWHSPVTVPAVWTRSWGRGHVFACTIGHSPAELEIPEVRTIIERGMLWAARTA